MKSRIGAADPDPAHDPQERTRPLGPGGLVRRVAQPASVEAELGHARIELERGRETSS